MSEYVSKEELKEFFEGIEITVAGRTRAEAIREIFQAIYNGVMKLPTTDAVPHWIPCSERLPEDGRYLCDYGDCIDFGRVINGEWYVNGVIAWMPLPEPYEGEGR